MIVMGFFRKIFRRHHEGHDLSFEEMALLYSKGKSFRVTQAMRLSAVYRCVNCISESVAQLPLEIFRIDAQGYKKKDRKHNLFGILNCKPNARMTRYVFISLMVQSMLLKGNAFAYINRSPDRKEVRQLIFIPADMVTIIYPPTLDQPVSYVVGASGWQMPVKASDMIHIVNQTEDGVLGISTIEYASRTLRLSNDAEQHASNFFSSGCAVGGVLASEKPMSDKQIKKIKQGWRQAFGRDGESNGVAVLEGGLKYQPITINAKDAQLLETRQFNVIDICRFFGVSPVKAFDLTKSSYSTVEATNIGFLTDTLSPLLEKIELEFETKLFGTDCNVDVRFDVAQLLRADKQSLAQYYSTMFQIGAYAPNEIRREIDLPAVEGGDENYVQVNLQTLKRAASENPADSQDIKEKLNEKQI